MHSRLGRVRTNDRVKMMLVVIVVTMIPIVVTLVGIVTDASA